MAQREDPQKYDACGVSLREHLREASLVLGLPFLVLEDDIGAVHAEHHAARLLMMSLALQPRGRLGDFAPADQQEDAGYDGGAEHEPPSAIDVAQSEADDCGHGSAQIPRRRDHAHGYRAVVLGGELGDERGRDGVVERISFRLRRFRDSFLGCHMGSPWPVSDSRQCVPFCLKKA